MLSFSRIKIFCWCGINFTRLVFFYICFSSLAKVYGSNKRSLKFVTQTIGRKTAGVSRTSLAPYSSWVCGLLRLSTSGCFFLFTRGTWVCHCSAKVQLGATGAAGNGCVAHGISDVYRCLPSRGESTERTWDILPSLSFQASACWQDRNYQLSYLNASVIRVYIGLYVFLPLSVVPISVLM